MNLSNSTLALWLVMVMMMVLVVVMNVVVDGGDSGCQCGVNAVGSDSSDVIVLAV